MSRLVVDDAAFTQTAAAILVTLTLALLLQAKLVAGPGSHLISSRGRTRLVIFDLFLTTLLSADAIGLGLFLIDHLATSSHALGSRDRRAVGLFLSLLLTGLALIAYVNRLVAVGWRAPERPYLEPEFDGDLMYGLVVASGLAGLVAIGALVLLIFNQLPLALLVIVAVGAVAARFGPYLATALNARANQRIAARLEAAAKHGEYHPCLTDVPMPGGLGTVRAKTFRPSDPARAECLPHQEAARLVRHFNNAWDHLQHADRYADVPPTRLRIALTQDSRSTVVAQPRPGVGSRRLRSMLTRQPPTGAPLGLVAWVPGNGVPSLRESRADPYGEHAQQGNRQATP